MTHSLFFEDFEVGQHFESGGRTITEADLTMFSMLSGDWNPIHADAEFARTTRYAQRVVHGTLGIAIATGMLHQLGIFHDSAVAMMSLNDWKFVAPIFVGDTLRLRLEITALDGGRSLRVGKLGRRFVMLNQRDEIVQDGHSDLLIAKRGA
ncbi:MaoC/PaaZ C-terminal domain-containing protein [Paraburkholderia sp.]|uniref:MaoC/PaaZ C-terminal domain-containing protein n=1 Tax=Paraburkholderia sp. TaxID=1926495 RepID=UPI002383388F|nr:MaoC/PaaZ C-terminal domain-containing protein [Paraburkholderia sp.]MDE1178965.1 MaoC/PaaZ C-terminal domain-containing protein [Paraburkholderia sp.]